MLDMSQEALEENGRVIAELRETFEAYKSASLAARAAEEELRKTRGELETLKKKLWRVTHLKPLKE